MAKKTVDTETQSAEEKIKAVASKLFTQKGFDATTTREIAEQAGINLALLNYYFRSKQKLYALIMQENMMAFKHGLVNIMGDKNMEVPEKFEQLAVFYIDSFIANKDLAVFIVNVVNNKDSSPFLLDEDKNPMDEPRKFFAKQIEAYYKSKHKKSINPMHIISSLLGLIMFPFIMRPMLLKRASINDKEFIALMIERKKLVPEWMKQIINS